MDHIVFLVFRQMRTPLLALIVAYSIAVVGFVLIPGRDASGAPAQMDFFHAFYFVGFMSTTIGFGEIPYPFTDAQRLWTSICIFLTVSVWLYSAGTLIALLQDKTFQRALAEQRFARKVRRLCDPFYLICGYGETGSTLVRALTERDQHAVAIDIRPERTALLQLENLREFVPALTADARSPAHLLDAGLRHPLCAGVAALTNVNATNLKIAITAKLLNPKVPVICRADSVAVEANMASFGTDHIYDPFDTFALYLATAIQSPQRTRLFEWLTGDTRRTPPTSRPPPASGRWILCGFGRFGKALYRHLTDQGLELVFIEARPEHTGKPEGAQLIVGPGTEAPTLEEAGVAEAVGLIAGTDDDANNLSIIMTARQLNSTLFVVARENHSDNHGLFCAVDADIVMHPSTIIAERIQLLLATPLLAEFRRLARRQDEAWAQQLVERINALVLKEVLTVWEVTLDTEDAHAAHAALVEESTEIPLVTLLRNPHDRDEPLSTIALLHCRGDLRTLLPGDDLLLHRDDKLLFCGLPAARARVGLTLQNPHAFAYVMSGHSRYEGRIWRRLGPWLARRIGGAV
ncbi:K+ transport system, NAD-binding component [Thioflavicoccus mobilis 8321]|uniref:K+ transport system, NAD-binding component n=1 Tax=Thioflavicoccus mobilis 8321 TaxID=765912 RepID=L0GZ72_9GAMM|nr:potassium channel family protein [Thioflavicoccus mobilis]AGA90609.1 K+ transport system, NAD-binding component [Thioflavicoccus mobilis 8321]